MIVHTHLSKQCRFGMSEWDFGQLPSGWLAAFGSNGKKLFFRNLKQMDDCISKFVNDYGYKKPSSELVQQLALF